MTYTTRPRRLGYYGLGQFGSDVLVTVKKGWNIRSGPSTTSDIIATTMVDMGPYKTISTKKDDDGVHTWYQFAVPNMGTVWARSDAMLKVEERTQAGATVLKTGESLVALIASLFGGQNVGASASGSTGTTPDVAPKSAAYTPPNGETPSPTSTIPWVPIAIGGGVLLVTIIAAMAFSKK
jgi:hypothetical protein